MRIVLTLKYVLLVVTAEGTLLRAFPASVMTLECSFALALHIKSIPTFESVMELLAMGATDVCRSIDSPSPSRNLIPLPAHSSTATCYRSVRYEVVTYVSTRSPLANDYLTDLGIAPEWRFTVPFLSRRFVSSHFCFESAQGCDHIFRLGFDVVAKRDVWFSSPEKAPSE